MQTTEQQANMSTLTAEGFDDAYIRKTICVLINNPVYLTTISDAINPLYYENEPYSWVVERLLDYNAQYPVKPGVDYFKKELNALIKMPGTEEFVKRVRGVLNQAYTTEIEDVQYVQDTFKKFCQQQSLRMAIFQSVELIKTGRENDIPKLMESALSVGQREVLGHDYKEDAESRYELYTGDVIPMPFPVYDQRMTVGGLLPGNLVLIMGPGGGGKTWFVINWVNYLLNQGFDVLHFNLESRFDYVGKRYDANRLGVPSEELNDQLELVKDHMEKTPGRLHIKDLNGEQRTLTYMKKYIKFLERETGFYPKFVVIDFIKRMKLSPGRHDITTAQAELLKEVIDFGKEFNFPIVSPLPINRSGSLDSVEVIKEEHIAGTFEAMYDADLILAWSKSQALNWIKNKNGSAKHVDQLDYDPATGRFFYVGNYVEGANQKISANDVKNIRKMMNKQ